MDVIARNDEAAVGLAKFMELHNGIDTVALYIGERSTIADYFVISTGTSSGHIQGLVRNITDYLRQTGIEILNKKKTIIGDEWVLIDCGNIMIHVFNEEKRSFYDLERLWFDGEVLYHSSNSSSSS
jgi:ribosome-associated protein